MTKSNLYELFSNYLIRKFESKCTIKIYSNCGYNFIYENHPDTIEKLSNDYLLKYVTEIKKQSISKYNQILSVLKHLYNGVLNQKSKLKNVKCIKQYPKLKTLPDIEVVKSNILNIKNIKHKALLSTLLITGVRINELLNIKISDVDSNKMKILISNGKGGYSDFVILTDYLLSVLREYYKKEKPKEYLFEGLNGKYSKTSVNNLVKKHIGNKYSAHWLRKVAITHLINKNIPLHKTKLFSRHRSDNAVAFYYHYDNNTFDELREVVSSLSA